MLTEGNAGVTGHERILKSPVPDFALHGFSLIIEQHQEKEIASSDGIIRISRLFQKPR